MFKKVLQAITVVGLTVGFSLGVAAAADTNCDITNTGPDSTNSCTDDTSNNVTVTCTNGIYVVDTNSQDANSGGANNSGNGNSGGATTGNAVNQNGETVTIGAACTPATTTSTSTPPTTTTSVTPATAQVAAVPVGAVHAGGGAGDTHVTVPLVAALVASISGAVYGMAQLGRKLVPVRE